MCKNGDGCCPAACNHNNDSDCSATCGNGIVESGETCDGANCPTDCNDGNACTTDMLTGSAANCSAACTHTLISQCTSGDGCCPAGCNNGTDTDCSAKCGDGIVQPPETCDGVNCPTSCNDGNACTKDTLTGSATNCSAACSFQTITACVGGDGCCPAGCTHNSDSDCSATCGNNIVEVGETCDGNCPTSCNDGNACTKDSLTGSAMNCSAVCSFQPITTCTPGDGCCPAGCNHANDSDCSAFCGDKVVEAGETCDGNCPSDCNDGNACTIDRLLGSAATCSAQCDHTVITQCTSGDGCCPAGCNHATDSDCSATCGNGTVEAGETCDGNCPTSCDDSNACTVDTLTGSAANCSAKCTHAPITQCQNGDGCCPSGCNHSNDNDCLGSSPIGGACAQASDCASGECFLQFNTGYNGGYCTLGCIPSPSPSPTDCGTGNHCGAVNATTGNGFCLKSCTSIGDCRTAPSPSPAPQDCYDVDGDTRKECFSVAALTGGAAVGTPCVQDNQCAGGQAGFCQTQAGQGFKDGYCTTVCDPAASPSPTPQPGSCPSGSTCTLNGALGLNTCFKNCTAQADCGRGTGVGNGYDCFNIGAASNICSESANGTGNIGDTCAGYWECKGGINGNCLGFTNGYCSQFCDAPGTCTGNGNCCASGSTCVPNAVGSTFSLCEKDCTDVSQCRQADGFQCIQPPMDTNKECIQ
jgi:hypothetical protein